MTTATRLLVVLLPALVAVPACHPTHAAHPEHAGHGEHHALVATSPQVRDVTVTQQYVCQIHSQRNSEIRALQEGYLESIPVKEGQAVKAGQVLFTVVPTIYKARLDAETAEAELVRLKLANTQRLVDQNVVSPNELALMKAELAKAAAKVKVAEAELSFTAVRAPFDGIVDRLLQQQGSLVKKEDLLTTVSDNAHMWVYFNVPEVRYLEYMTGGKEQQDANLELVLADGRKFPHHGAIRAIEARFNNETGNIPFRADFPNPDRLLRHGQTGNVLINRTVKSAVVIPQRATFEILDKRFVFVVGKDGVVKQREITVAHEQDDIFLIGKGLAAGDKFLLEGVRQVKDGDKVECEFVKPAEALADQKHHAE